MTTAMKIRRGRSRADAIAVTVAAISSAGALTACGSAVSPASAVSGGPSAGMSAVTLATSLATARNSWAVVPVSANPAFWQVLVRPTAAAAWRLVTPPGVADSNGLVAADGGNSLTVAVRPSQALLFSPLAFTADAGTTWSTPAPLSTGVAAYPGALAAAGRRLLAVLGDGAIEASANAGSAWRTVARPGAIAASPAGRGCGTVAVASVTFGITASQIFAAGSCGASGAAAIFSYDPSSGWQRLKLPVSGHLVAMSAQGPTLVAAKAGLTALWSGVMGFGGPLPSGGPLASPPPPPGGALRSAPLPVTGAVTASGELAGSTPTVRNGAWVLLPGGRAATISGPGQPWVLLPPAPAGTSVLASGPGGAVDALAAAGAKITVWRLARAATIWRKIQTITVPIQYASSH